MGISLDIPHKVFPDWLGVFIDVFPSCSTPILSHSEPPSNISLSSDIVRENDGENFIATVNFLVSHNDDEYTKSRFEL